VIAAILSKSGSCPCIRGASPPRVLAITEVGAGEGVQRVSRLLVAGRRDATKRFVHGVRERGRSKLEVRDGAAELARAAVCWSGATSARRALHDHHVEEIFEGLEVGTVARVERECLSAGRRGDEEVDSASTSGLPSS